MNKYNNMEIARNLHTKTKINRLPGYDTGATTYKAFGEKVFNKQFHGSLHGEITNNFLIYSQEKRERILLI